MATGVTSGCYSDSSLEIGIASRLIKTNPVLTSKPSRSWNLCFTTAGYSVGEHCDGYALYPIAEHETPDLKRFNRAFWENINSNK